MGGCRCSYKNCASATNLDKKVHFFHYPVRDIDRCKVWIERAEKPSFRSLPREKLRNKVICEYHFDEKSFMNFKHDRLVHDAVPTDHPLCVNIEEGVQFTLVPKNKDKTEFSFTEAKYMGPSYTFENNTLIPSHRPQYNAGERYKGEPSLPAVKNEITSANCVNAEEKRFETNLASKTLSVENCNKVVFASASDSQNSDVFKKPDIHKPDVSIPNTDMLKNNTDMLECDVQTVEPNMQKSKNAETQKNDEPSLISITNSDFVRQISENSKQISELRRMLWKQMRHNQYKGRKRRGNKSRTFVLNYLKRRLNPALYNLVKVELVPSKKVDRDTLKLLKELYVTSPLAYNMIKGVWEWKIPSVNELIDV